MLRPSWVERVRAELVRRGLPPAYAARLLAELSDHAEELGEGAEYRLGTPEDLAGAAVLAYRSGRLAGRHPVAVFLLLPLIAVVAGLLVHAILVVAALEWLTSVVGQVDHPAVVWAVIASVRLIGYVSPLAVVAGGWLVHLESGRPVGWYLALALLVAGFAALIITGFDPSASSPTGFEVHLVPPNGSHRPAQAVVTGAVGLTLVVLRRIREASAAAAVTL